jgi:fatty acid desaturase
LSLTEARRILVDLFAPKAWIYWADFLVTYAVGVACLVLCRRVVPAWSLQFALLFVVQCLAFYRAALFIHELVHQREDQLRVFRVVWNLLCGIPFLMPTFVYYTHFDHHRRAHYGTEHDGEYIPLRWRPRWHVFVYLALALVIPPAAVFRFLVLTPLMLAAPPVRRWAYRRLSSLVMDPMYVRPLPTKKTLRIIRWQELGCFAYLAVVAARLAVGAMPWGFVPHAYATAVFIIAINSLRTLGSHRWLGSGETMSFLDQLDDSVNYPHRPWITELWGPLGLRYHALHHLFPSLPYHAMGEAHRRLTARLAPDSAYHGTTRVALWETLAELWRAPRQHATSEPQRSSARRTSVDGRSPSRSAVATWRRASATRPPRSRISPRL